MIIIAAIFSILFELIWLIVAPILAIFITISMFLLEKIAEFAIYIFSSIYDIICQII
ncbi:hypothetical protein [Campylobacter lanienae]|uniref:hypothetical protein n=1 Tax=Campylobacter lanienae TaxID=75658 RepID=UPI00242E726C|nr:hypothetical protein [Campylobacter lanienae]